MNTTTPMNERTARAYLAHLFEPGDTVVGALVLQVGPVAAIDMLVHGKSARSWSSALIERTKSAKLRHLEHPQYTLIDQPWAQKSIDFIIPSDDAWPKSLDDLGASAPFGLWVNQGRRGIALSVLLGDQPVAVVGARAATSYGENVALRITEDLVRAGSTIVSGAAYGIDAAAHRAALAVGGTTIAVLAGGVDRPYPVGNSGIIERIIATGAVISEVPPGSAPTKHRFLARNRIIAALSQVSLVVEAGARSGSLNEAMHARVLQRPVAAVPGPITSAASTGTNQLIAGYAHLVTSAADVLALTH